MEIEYIEDSSNANEFLHYCTIIAKAFSTALDQNECNLKVTISIAEELKDLVKDAENIHEIINQDPAKLVPTEKVSNNTVYEDINKSPTDRFADNRAQASYLKQNCFKCDLGLPDINLTDFLKWTMDKIKTVLDIYKKLFEALVNPNLCHAAYAFQYTCIPDIIRLIALLLTVYTSILALRKLGGISLNAFIKGLISGLLGQIIGNINVQVNFSKSGIGCLINIFEELAAQVPDGENLSRLLTEEQMTELEIDPESSWQYKQYVQQLNRQTDGHMRNTSRVFKDISDTINKATKDFNENLENTFNIIDYLQCEVGRSGSDFIEVAEYMKKLVDIINLLSAIAVMVAKKQIQKKLCNTPTSLEDLYKPLPKEDLYTPITDLEITDVIEEYVGKVVELTKDENDEVLPLIIDKDKEQILPKLNFYTCNLKEFINSHTVEEITDRVIKDLQDTELEKKNKEHTYTPEEKRRREMQPFNEPGINIDNFTDKKNNWKKYPIEYVRPQIEGDQEVEEVLDGTVLENINKNKEFSLQNILDYVYNNPLDRKQDNKVKEKPEEGIDITSTQLKPQFRFSNPNLNSTTEQTSFDSSCRDIEDVMNQINNMRK